MYRCFELSIQTADFCGNNQECINEWKRQGKLIRTELENKVEDILVGVTDSEGIIDGQSLMNTWFPIEKKDIFLSYSHNDEELALIIVGILKEKFGLTVFMDEIVWGSADSLLRTIDNKYCSQDNGTYNYKKRNFSTSHVHAMLTTSIMKVMDQAEAIFFLNTSNSIYKLKNGFSAEHTLSPWIYEEIMMTTVLRERDWKEYRRLSMNENTNFQKSLNIVYPLGLEDFKTITFEELVNWSEVWTKRKINDKGRYGSLVLNDYEKVKHPLNVLYEIMFGVK